MGEGKRREASRTSLEAILGPMEEHSTALVLVSGDTASLARAREIKLASRLLESAVEQLEQNPQREALAVRWVRRSNRTEEAAMVRMSQALVEFGAESLCQQEAHRGREVRMGLLTSERTLVANWQAKAAQAATIARVVRAQPGLNLKAQRVMDGSDIGTRIINVPHDRLWEGGLKSVLMVLDECMASTEEALQNRQRIGLAITGLDEDQREVWEIPEARRFYAALGDACPWWPWLLHPLMRPAMLCCSIEHRTEVVPGDGPGKQRKKIVFDPEQVGQLKARVDAEMKMLASRWGVRTEEQFDKVFGPVMKALQES